MSQAKKSLNPMFVLIAIAVIVIAGWFWSHRNEGDAAPPLSRTPANANALDQQTLNEFRRLQARESEYDRTVWADEMMAQQYEQVIIDLWDRMRAATNKFSLIAKAGFEELILNQAGAIKQHGHGIREVEFDGDERTRSHTEWIDLLNSLQADGVAIEQSEWRQTGFEAEAEQGAVSTISMSVHALNPLLNERHILTGDLAVSWKKRGGNNTGPEVESIRVSHLNLKTRENQIAFRNVLKRVLPTSSPSSALEPVVLIYDLDGDGLSEIILAEKNIVFRNHGNMHFEAGPFVGNRPQLIFTGLLADVTGDGQVDFLAADANGLLLWHGSGKGVFADSPQRVWSVRGEPLLNVFAISAGDIDGDRDLDVWIGQYKKPYVGGQMPTPYYDANDGFPGFLLRNDGSGRFEDITEKSGIAAKRFRRTYSGSFVDIDNDRDLDLVTMNDFAGVDVFLNDGQGSFRDATDEIIDERHLFGMAHSFGDFNLDGQLDIFAVGMTSSFAERLDGMGLGRPDFPDYQKMRSAMSYGNRLYFGDDGKFRMLPMSDSVRDAGWAWGSTVFDFDNDADLDLYVSNGHATRSSAKDYDADFWTHDIYVANSRLDPAVDLYFRAKAQRNYDAGISHGGNYRNNFFINENNESFLESAHLMGVAFPRDYRHAIAEDLDGDGKQDLVLTIYEDWPRLKQELEIYQNVSAETGDWIGFWFEETDPRHSPIGATVTIESGGRKQFRQIVAGDSYRTQNSFTAHFGLGDTGSPVSGEIIWPDGTITEIENFETGSWHLLTPLSP